MFYREDIVRVANHEGYRKCLIIPGFLQNPDFYTDEAIDMPYKFVDILDLRWGDRDMVNDKMQLEFIGGLYEHINREKYDTIYVHGISDSIIYKLMLFGKLNIPVVYMCPYCIPEEEREKHYKLLCIWLKYKHHIPIKLQLYLLKRQLGCEDDFFALYLLEKFKNIKSNRILKRFEDSLVSIEQTQELEGIFIYGDDEYTWPTDYDEAIRNTCHYPLQENFTETMHKAEVELLQLYKGREVRHA